MNEIYFPGFNLKFNISSIAFKIFGIEIYWYAIFIVSALVIGLILCKKDDGKYKIAFNDILELSVIAIPVAFIFARLYFVLFNLKYYFQSPLQIFNIRNGGLAIYGGIFGGIFTTCIFCKIKKINILDMLDYLAPYIPLGQAIGRLGNFTNVEAYGTTTNSIFRMGIIENDTYIEVHPTFLYESLANLILFIILYVIRNKREFKGELTCLYFIGYGFIRTIIEGLRSDSLMLNSFKISQVVSCILFIVFSIILIIKLKNNLKIKNIFIALFLIGLDQLIKYMVIDKNITIIPNILSLTYTKNIGIAYSISINKILLVLLSLIIIICLILAIVSFSKEKNIQFLLIFILSGAIGNFIDRIFRNFVIDYINLEFIHFPIFNLADIFIVLPIIILILVLLKQYLIEIRSS